MIDFICFESWSLPHIEYMKIGILVVRYTLNPCYSRVFVYFLTQNERIAQWTHNFQLNMSWFALGGYWKCITAYLNHYSFLIKVNSLFNEKNQLSFSKYDKFAISVIIKWFMWTFYNCVSLKIPLHNIVSILIKLIFQKYNFPIRHNIYIRWHFSFKLTIYLPIFMKMP